MKLILLGPPGSGKGLFSQFLERDYNIKHIATGDLLREEINKKTKLGRSIEGIVNRGRLISNDIINKIVEERLKGYKNFVLDGYPRNLEQAEYLDKIEHIDKVIYITSSRDVIIKRIATRVQCSKCNKIYNLETKEIRPKKEGYCDICNAPLYVREDDKKVIEERIMVYEKEIGPLLDFYKEKGVLVEIEGNRLPNAVYKDIRKIIK
ncbi:MAG: nucleoside monophosphate kinase [Nanoarchaeota archaeon]